MTPVADRPRLVADDATGYVTGRAETVQSLLEAPGEAGTVLRDAGLAEHAARHPQLTRALAAARTPGYRVWTEGLDPEVTILGDAGAALAIFAAPSPDRTLLALTGAEAPLALVDATRLGPRPVPGHAPVRLAPGAMAILIGRRQAHGHGLALEQATELQDRLDAGVRHWSVRLARPNGRGGELRRNVEILDGQDGIWHLRPVGDTLVELAPTSSTAVLRELVELLALAREPLSGPR